MVSLNCVRRLVVGSAVRWLETSPLTHLASSTQCTVCYSQIVFTDRFHWSYSNSLSCFLCPVSLDCVRRLVVGSALRWLETSPLTHLASPLFDTLYCSLLTDRFYRSFSLVVLQLVELFLCLVALDCVRRLIVGSAVRWLETSPLTHLASLTQCTVCYSQIVFTDRFHWSYSNSLSCFYVWLLSIVSVDASSGVPCGGS